MAEPEADRIEAYLAGELDGSGVAALEAWLLADEAHRRRFVAAARRRVHLRSEIAAHLQRADAGLSAKRLRSPRRARPPIRLHLWAAAAAVLLLCLTTVWFLTSVQHPVGPTLSDCGVGSSQSSGGRTLSASDGARVLAGDRLTGPCSIRFPDGSMLELAAEAAAELPASDEARLALISGGLSAKVAPQPDGVVFSIRTPQALVTVVGTRFSIVCTPGLSRVTVDEGHVRVGNASGERLLGPGDSVVATATALAGRVLQVAAADTPRLLAGSVTYSNVQVAIDAAQPGDLIQLLPGTHTGTADGDAPILVRCRGRPDAWITIAGDPAGGSLFRSRAWNGLLCEDAAFVRISCLVITGDPEMPANVIGNGICLRRSHHIEVRDCRISDCAGDGVAVLGCDHVVVAGNRIERCSLRSRWGQGGISICTSVAVDDAPGPHVVITGNRISGCRDTLINEYGGTYSGGNGIGLFRHRDGDGGTDDPAYAAYRHPILVRGNVCTGNDGAGIALFSTDDVQLDRNTLHRNGRGPGTQAEVTCVATLGIRLTSNLIAPLPDRQAIRTRATDAYTSAGDLVWGGDAAGLTRLDACPWPAVPDENVRSDFRLRPGSLASDCGAPVTEGPARQ
jgi:parallel beta-helix repeat protein